MMLARRFNGQPVAGWLMSEKFDGCRAFWDGRALRTRTWNAIPAPAWFTARLPRDVTLDGELWLGRGTFERMKVLVQFDRSTAADWNAVQYVVFDAPTCEAIPLEARLKRAAELADAAKVSFATNAICQGPDHALAEMNRAQLAGGEGIVLKRPGSYYSFDRSSDWLKVKPAHVD
jgi:DNA ligase-1